LRGLAALVLGASAWIGVRALVHDFDLAFHEAGKSVFPPSVARQLDAIRARVPAGDSLLLLAASRTDGPWWARLFQRALYPRNSLVVRYEPLPADELAQLNRVWRFRHGVLLSREPSSLVLSSREDLGSLPGLSDHVWLGDFAP
jgi:hypothetical protein